MDRPATGQPALLELDLWPYLRALLRGWPYLLAFVLLVTGGVAWWSSTKPSLYESAAQLPVMVDKTLAERFEDGDEYIYTPN